MHLYISIHLTFISLLFIALCYDLYKFVIPNILPTCIFLLFFPAAYLSPFSVQWAGHFVAAGGVLMVGAVLFHFKLLGGGDVKLLTAVALWTGLQTLPSYLVAVALAGGLLALTVMAVRTLVFTASGIMRSEKVHRHLPRLLARGESLPYGVAIGGAGIFVSRDLPILPYVPGWF
jgi:prepilin peptidase CpaA